MSGSKKKAAKSPAKKVGKAQREAALIKKHTSILPNGETTCALCYVRGVLVERRTHKPV